MLGFFMRSHIDAGKLFMKSSKTFLGADLGPYVQPNARRADEHIEGEALSYTPSLWLVSCR